MEHPPTRIETERFVLRRYDPADATLVQAAVEESLEHLRPFMDWAWAAPEPLGAYEARLGHFGNLFDRGEDFAYGIFSHDGLRLLGSCGLHRRVGPVALEIGYWVRASETRRGLATEASAVLTRVGFDCCRVERMEIHHDPANEPSATIPRRLGYVYEATLRCRLPPTPPVRGGRRRDEAIHSLLAEEYPGSGAAAIATAALRGADAA